MELLVNGGKRTAPDNSSLQDLIASLKLPPERIAIELNQRVVRRSEWETIVLNENDRVEIVHFVGGGERQ